MKMRVDMVLSLPLCAICLLVPLTSSAPLQETETDDSKLLQVTIPSSAPVSVVLGGSLTLPCLVSLSQPPPSPSTNGERAAPSVPRVKWSVLTEGHDMEILVARGDRVKVSEAYKDRAALLHYASSPADLSLRLAGLRYNDTGFYRCEVQHGLEDAHDVVQVKVRGVVFHYRDASSRYAFTFERAREACEEIGAQMAGPDHLLAAYHSGYEQCDAGWLSDHSVRYPIQMPREGCFGDMDGLPGVRNYGLLESDELYDAYCYVENIDGEVFHGSSPHLFTLWEAKAYCLSQWAELATTGQLYAAWNDGLHHCSPGWLADGSVRYPIVTPRERCGGGEPGVRTVYRYSNQTGFPEAHTYHDVYCFRSNNGPHTEHPQDYVATEPEDIDQDIVSPTNAMQEVSFSLDSKGHSAPTAPPVPEEHVVLPTAEGHEPTMSSQFTPDPREPVSPPPENEDHLLTKDTWEAVEAILHPRSYRPGPEEHPDSNQTVVFLEESDRAPTSSPEDVTAASEVNEEQPQPSDISENINDNNTLVKISAVNGSSFRNTTIAQNSSSDRDVGAGISHETESVIPRFFQEVSGMPDEAGAGAVEEGSVGATLPHVDELDLHSSTPLPDVGNSTPQQEESATLLPYGDTSSLLSSSQQITESSESVSVGTDESPECLQNFTSSPLHISEYSQSGDTDDSSADHTGEDSVGPSESSSTSTDQYKHINPADDDDDDEHDHDDPLSSSLSPTLVTLEPPAGETEYSTLLGTPTYASQHGGTTLQALAQEGLGDSQAGLHNATHTTEPDTIEQDWSGSGSGEESGGSSGEGSSGKGSSGESSSGKGSSGEGSGAGLEVSPTSHPLCREPEGGDVESGTDIAVTLVADVMVSPGWEVVPRATAPQESQSNVEYSGDALAVTQETHDVPAEEPTDTPRPFLGEPTVATGTLQTHHHGEEGVVFPDAPPFAQISYPPPPGSAADLCLGNPCLNGGTCVDGESKRCLCLPSYGGESCQTDLEACEAGWEKFQGFCYRHFTSPLNWEVAEQRCRMCGAHLVSVMSPEEQDYINEKYKEYQWIGLNDKTIEGDFRWSDGNPLLYENWYPGQPDSYFLSGEDCAVMVWHDSGHWSDVPCNYHLSYTCKKGTSSCSKPPEVPNAKLFGRTRPNYETNSRVRYYCEDGFHQRLNPLIMCLPNGQWEEPQITCTPALASAHEGDQVTAPAVQSDKSVETVETPSKQDTSHIWDIDLLY